MNTRALRITLSSMICLVLLATFSTSGAQMPASSMPLERTWLAAPELPPPPPEPHMAPLRPGALEPPPPGTGFVPPPMDLSHLTGQGMPEGIKAAALPSSFDWRDNGGNYVTSVEDQKDCGSCYTFAALGNIESKLLIDGAGTFDFSENNAKECNWRELNNFQYPNPGNYWGSCDGGNYFMLASLFSQKGTVLGLCDPYVASDVSCNSTCSYQKTLLDWRIIPGTDTNLLKQYIYAHGPVNTSMYADTTQGFNDSYNGSSTLNYTTSGDATNHAVLIVGWSNNLPPAPGVAGPADGWIVKNSWGAGWGDNGYFYITYGSANIGTASSFMHEWQDYDANGDIWYYDDDSWWGNWGYDDETTWGLVKFPANSDTNVTRVEFWTTDATTDIDIYIHDSFDGTTLGNLLASKLNLSFDEAGYHSVALDSPLAVNNGDTVVAAVKFTNNSYGYPIAADPHGKIETGRTYMSHSGSSWSDMGMVHNTDVAIRLRTSTNVAPPPTVTSIEPNEGENTGVVPITNLVGSNFQDDADVKLTRSGQMDINAANVTVVSESKITCDLPLSGVAAGKWNVVVTNPDNQYGALTDGFTVKAPPAPNVSIRKQIIGSGFEPGDRITFTLTIANEGDLVATHVVVTDALPTEVLSPTFDSTLVITLTGVSSYAWDVGSLGVGEGGAISIYGQIDPNVESDFLFANTATISDPADNSLGNNTGRVTVVVGKAKIYLPAVMRLYPPLPNTPVLDPVDNSDYDGNYTVSWNAADRANTYVLEEDTHSSFSSPTAYPPSDDLSRSFTGQADGIYYYRVKARNSWGDSGWSTTRSVTVQSGPTPGYWMDPSGVDFYVTTDGAYVDNFAIYVGVEGCGNYKIPHNSPEAITNDQFSFSGSFYASGTFHSTTTASGSTGLDHYYIPGCGYVTTNGPLSWSATWQNSSQPTSTSGGIVELETVESTTTTGKFYTVTLVK